MDLEQYSSQPTIGDLRDSFVQ